MISGPIAMTSSKRSPLSSSFLERRGHVAVLAAGAVVRHQREVLGAGLEFVLEDHEVLVAEADDRGDLGAEPVQLFGDWQRDGAADAAADHADLLEAVEVAGRAERADEIGQAVALVQVVQLFSRRADNLENDRDRALLAVVPGDRQRDALAVRLGAQDNELAGLRLFRDERRVDFHPRDGGVQRFFFQNRIHNSQNLSFSFAFLSLRRIFKRRILQKAQERL